MSPYRETADWIMPARPLTLLALLTATCLGACATGPSPSGLTTSNPRPAAPLLPAMRQPQQQSGEVAARELPPPPEPRIVYRGGRDGSYAPSPYWSGQGPPPPGYAAAPSQQQPQRYYDPVPQQHVAAQPPAAYPPPAPTYAPPPAAYAPVPPQVYAPAPPPAASPSVATAPAAVRVVNGQRIVDVRPGDTLFSIAKQHRVSMSGLMQANRLASVKLMPGQQLVLPRG